MRKADDPILPAEIPYKLTRVEGELAEHVAQTVLDPEARFRAHPLGRAWIQETFDGEGDEFKWDGNTYASWRRIPTQLLSEVFTFGERARLWHDSVFRSELSEHIEKQESFLWKIRNTQWRYGCTSDWNALVDHLDGLKRLSTTLPDFEVRLTHTHSFNPVGWSEHDIDGNLIYLDGAFGALLYFKGKHVLTVGFSLSADHVLIAQVQLRVKKKNRFLYHLPKHYFDIALDILGDAFGHDKLALVTGDRTKFSDDARARVKALYDRSLTAYSRGEVVGQWYGRQFVSLQRTCTRKAA